MFASAKFAVVLAFFTATALAVPATFKPTDPNVEIVDRPQITAPEASDIWPVGSQQTVRWDTTKISPENYGNTGIILLGYLEEGDDSEHLSPKPIASGFPIISGSVNVTVPNVDARNDYIVVLFGDSGNASPKFIISNATA